MSTFNQKLLFYLKKKRSNLCVGLDPDISFLPEGYQKNLNGLKDHMIDIINITYDQAIAYKINFAFFECWGSKGFQILEEILAYFESLFSKDNVEKKILIADAKRGDIDNTSKKYAKAFFETWNFDAITIHPYMGFDSILPFIEYQDKGTIILLVTSNSSNKDLQFYGNPPLYERMIELGKQWNKNDNILYVVGATVQEDILRRIALLEKNIPLLIPGVGAQKGNLELIMKLFSERAIVNISRSIMYASDKREELPQKIEEYINNYLQQIQKFL